MGRADTYPQNKRVKDDGPMWTPDAGKKSQQFFNFYIKL